MFPGIKSCRGYCPAVPIPNSEAFTNAAKHANASAVNIVIEEADGTLTVDSPAGAGTVLTLLLPVTADNH